MPITINQLLQKSNSNYNKCMAEPDVRPPGAAMPSGLSICYSKFLSQQRHLPDEPENCTLEPRGIWNCVRLQCTRTSGVSISVPIRFSFVDQRSPRRLENFGENIPTSPDVIEDHTLNFKPNFKFSRLIFFLGGDPMHVGGWAR